MVILTLLILPIHEHGISFHLFVSYSISFISVLQFSEYSFISLVRFIPRYKYFHFYVFSMLVMSPNLGEEAFCRRHSMSPSSALPSGHQSFML